MLPSVTSWGDPSVVTWGDLIVVFLLLLLIPMARIKLKRAFPSIPINIITLSFVYHIIVTVWPLTQTDGDSAGYFRATFAVGWPHQMLVGTAGIVASVYPLTRFLGLGYFGCTLIFSVLGYVGILLSYLAIRRWTLKARTLQKWGTIFLFLPGLNLWTAGIGKDSFILLAIGLTLYFLPNKKKWMLAVFGVCLAFLIRPHVGIMLVVALIIATLFSKGVSFKVKIVGLVICVTALLLTYKLAASYVGLDLFQSKMPNANVVSLYLKKRRLIDSTVESDSNIDVSGYPLPAQVFIFLFYPLFFNAHNIAAMIASVENLFYLGLFARVARPRFLIFIAKKREFLLQFSGIFFVIFTVVFAVTNYNLGLSARMKTMMIPFAFMVLVIVENGLIKGRHT